MQSKYEEKTGMPFDENNNIGINISVLSEYLNMICDKVDNIKRQAFFGTATGENLDNHGKLRGIKRYEGKKAKGEITFYRDNTSSKKILLPRGIICETSNLLEERFITKEDKILDIGENSISIPAESVEIGQNKNVPEGKIDMLVSSIFGIKNIINLKSFSYGADEEKDEEYRERIVSHYTSCPNGANLGFYKNICLSYTGVSDIAVKVGLNEIFIYLKFLGNENTNTIDLIYDHINTVKEMGRKITVLYAREKLIDFNLNIFVKQIDKKQESINNLKENINNYINRLKIGEIIYLSKIINIALFDENIVDVKILDHEDNIFPNSEEYFKVGSLRIS